MKFISLFAGVGGFDLALNRLGHECVYANEWDKYSAITYEKNFGTNICRCSRNSSKGDGEASTSKQSLQSAEACIQCGRSIANHLSTGNTGSIQHPLVDTRSITEVRAEDIPAHDLLVGGFPCPSFSIAGKRKGLDDVRGQLIFDIIRILRVKKPKMFLLENVAGLLSHDGGRTMEVICEELCESGYAVDFELLNSKNFGVPQNRLRVFIIGKRLDTMPMEMIY